MLNKIANLVTPDTLRAWYRHLIVRMWTYERKGPGRPYITKVDNQLQELSKAASFSTAPVQRRERLWVLLSFYHREAA